MATLLILGDSVTWGQGLLDAHKFSHLFHAEIQRRFGPVTLEVRAHSGAIIGWNDQVTRAPLDGEIPAGHPTIRQQLETYPGDRAAVRWIVINGGINDIDIQRLLNPVVRQRTIERLTRRYCGDDLAALLTATGTAFPNATLFVVGYYPILSYESDVLGIEALFAALHGVEFRPLLDRELFRNALVEHCLAFWRVSAESMAKATQRVNTALGQPRCVYIDPGFAEPNAVFAPDARLWKVKIDLLQTFPPEDEIQATRIIACETNVAHPLERFTCCRASAGHPNVAGAAQIAARLNAALPP